MGRPGYDPADLLKLYIYGYSNRIRSSRRLEAETHRNVEVIWLLRHLKPGFKTIADFRRDIKAVNNKTRNFTWPSLAKAIQDAEERLASYMKRLDEGDADEDRTPGARAMARITKVGVVYNIQLAVDVKHKLIAKQAVSNQVLDLGLLAQTATAAIEALGVERIEAVADRGYFKIENIEACEAAGVPAALRSRCTRSFRRVSRLENEAVLDRMAARLPARPEMLDHRRNSVEHPFVTIKQWMGQGAFLMRRL